MTYVYDLGHTILGTNKEGRRMYCLYVAGNYAQWCLVAIEAGSTYVLYLPFTESNFNKIYDV